MRNKLLILFILLTLSNFGAYAQDVLQNAVEEAQSEENLPMADYSVTPKRYIVNDIKVYGVKHLNHTNMATVAGLKKGDEVYLPGNYISQAIRSFWNRRYFSDVEVVAETAGDSVNLHLYMKERPMVYTWEFTGIRKGEGNTFRNDLGLKEGYELSDFVINKNIKLIKDKYIDKGFRNVTVTPKIEDDPTFNNAAKVTFEINKGPRVKIGEVGFEGNEVFSDRQLRKTFKKTNQVSCNFLKSFKFKEKEFENDKENLIDFYNSKGYRNANILNDSIYPINEKRIGVKVELEEGNKYFFRNIYWVGNSVYSTETLQQLLGVNPNDTYDKKTLNKRLGIGKDASPDDNTSISAMYKNNGYLYSTIEPAEIIIGEDSIDLQIKIFEGQQAKLNQINIVGNMNVNDEVIRRELETVPGDLYNQALLMNTYRRLASMQHFNPEGINPQVTPVAADAADITWTLEEQASDKIEISGGWGSGMFVGSVGLQLNNFSTKNFFKKGEWRPYPKGQGQQLTISARSNGSYYKSFNIGFVEPWLRGKKPNSLSVSTFYSDQTNSSYFWQAGDEHFRTFGVDVGIGRRLRWPDYNFTLYNSVSYQLYNLKDWDYFILSNGNSNLITFNTVLERNSIDNPIFPRSGSNFSLSIALTPPYSLFDGKDYKDETLSDKERYRWIEYHKWKFKGQWFQPLSANNKLIFMAKAEYGYLGAYNKHKPSPYEGFDVGGDGMSGYNVYGVDVIGVRGYDDSALNPITDNNDYARAYNKYTLEVRYPLLFKPNSVIYGLVFAEGGNAFSGWKTFNPFQIKRSAGIGARIYLPMIGMLGIDWAYGFDKVPGSDKKNGSQVHYVIGTQF